MNFFWLIALAQALFIAFIISTGRIRIRGQLFADRNIESKRFWFLVAAFSVSLMVVVWEAFYQPY